MSNDRSDNLSDDAASELVVVRHGQSTYNRAHLFTGQSDPPLTELGQRQAVELAERCGALQLEAVAASDLARALHTARIVAAELGLPSPTALPELRERWSRELTGLTQQQVEGRFPGALAAWREGPSTVLPGDSEPFEQFRDRVLAGLRAAARLAPRVLVVAHAGLFRVLGTSSGSGLGAGLPNTGGRRIRLVAGRLVDAGDPFQGRPAASTGVGDL